MWQVLPDREAGLAAAVDIHETYLRSGLGPAMAKFIALVSFEGPLPPDYAERPAPDPAMFGLPTADDGLRGDPLVGHVIHVKPSQFQRSQPDYSTKTSAVERIRRVSPNMMEDSLIIWDPVNLAEPWHVVQHWKRITSAHARIDMWSCAANDNTVETANPIQRKTSTTTCGITRNHLTSQSQRLSLVSSSASSRRG